MELQPETCYRALATRDTRFDGLFFVGVTSTRIYCRPVCTARTPRPERCRFFPSAAAAEQAGFRPCLRCRPELAPGHSAIDAVERVARAAAARIEAGALNNGASLDDLAGDLGVSARQLRRVMRRELGVSPIELAQTHRLLLAKQLLTETRLPIIDVAFASGFESVRRFNALFLSHYRLSPGRFRRALDSAPEGATLRLRLGYRPPLAWDELVRFLGGRAILGVEWVEGQTYARTVALGSQCGWIRVAPAAGNSLCVEMTTALAPVLALLLARLRQLFDLNARPDLIAAHLATDRQLSAAVGAQPGLRIPGAFCGFELAWRAILGQRISVRAASAIASRLADRFGAPIETPFPELCRLTPSPVRIAAAPPEALAQLGMTHDRARTIHALAQAVDQGRLRLEPGVDPEATMAELKAFRGIGEWTAQVIAMRALGWPDAFPHSDLGLMRGLRETSPSRVRDRAQAWRPWRSYAVMHIWNGLAQPIGG